MERRPDLGTPRPDDLDFRDDPAMRERVPAYMNEALRREFAQSGYRLLTDPAPRDAPARSEAALRDANTDELPIASMSTVTGSNLPREQSRADPGRSHRVFPSDITK
ncbi:hypothetical protein AVE30378_04882 [Achromobacter veterisilvae]|uniref:Uncharacterized protein n=1 Tax=Achromobacter veterisilvae TaxID=2069367 RepID=A0A446CVW0_9BURK|nr:DUF3313 family protein [Achromobacter veterisilvae]SSW72014.1 hypothetical protein AVE30378_04882 [Achromobacter veterisilvae]